LHARLKYNVLFEGDPGSGLTPIIGDAQLGTIAFTAGNTAGTSPLTINVKRLQDPALGNLSVTPTNGRITIAQPATANASNLSFDPGVQTVATGTPNVTAGLGVVASAPGIGSYQIEVGYDNALLTATGCTAPAGAVCNHAANPNTVLFEGNSALGLSPLVGYAELGKITFTAGNTPGTSPLTVDVRDLREPDGDNLSVTPGNGQITIVASETAGTSALAPAAPSAVAGAAAGPQSQPQPRAVPLTGGKPGDGGGMPYEALALLGALFAATATALAVRAYKRAEV
jgi:hypothetical protein